MTSSLVGSEMCIRDRPYTTMSPRPPSTMERRGPRLAPIQQRLIHLHNRPVSYTHLTLPTICSV
eukprot:1716837-Prorocentrum_lima.AAC.1